MIAQQSPGLGLEVSRVPGRVSALVTVRQQSMQGRGLVVQDAAEDSEAVVLVHRGLVLLDHMQDESGHGAVFPAQRIDVFVRPPAAPLLERLALVLPDAGQSGATAVGQFQQLGSGPRRMSHAAQQALRWGMAFRQDHRLTQLLFYMDDWNGDFVSSLAAFTQLHRLDVVARSPEGDDHTDRLRAALPNTVVDNEGSHPAYLIQIELRRFHARRSPRPTAVRRRLAEYTPSTLETHVFDCVALCPRLRAAPPGTRAAICGGDHADGNGSTQHPIPGNSCVSPLRYPGHAATLHRARRW
ncbi:hypothetical protein ABZ464_36915 [Streptomyces sp. NPDC005820]|uniref:hypothetical protein n=1 Tax=Streptomyces sp. NPDC005820 TaxID=3157069 RepID=UPI0033DC20BD